MRGGDMELIKIFAERLRELRLEENLSTKMLGEKIKVSDATISRWENCLQTPTISQIVKLAKYFNVTTDYLCGLED